MIEWLTSIIVNFGALDRKNLIIVIFGALDRIIIFCSSFVGMLSQ